MFIGAVHFSVRQDNIIRKLAAYVILAIDSNGMKDIISLQIGENESSKYWLGVLNEPKNRGVQGAMVICADGLRRNITDIQALQRRQKGHIYHQCKQIQETESLEKCISKRQVTAEVTLSIDPSSYQ